MTTFECIKEIMEKDDYGHMFNFELAPTVYLFNKKPYNQVDNVNLELIKNYNRSDIRKIYLFLMDYGLAVRKFEKEQKDFCFEMGCTYKKEIFIKIGKNVDLNMKALRFLMDIKEE